MKQRDPKTGRFAAKTEAPKSAIANLAAVIEVTLKQTLQVATKKDLTGKTARMLPGSKIVLTPAGENLVRVKRQGSDRTFYVTTAQIQEGTY